MSVDKPILIILHQEHSTPGRVGAKLRERGYQLDIRRPPLGCDLLVDGIFLSVPMAVTPPTADLGFTIPLDPNSVGLRANVQALISDLTAMATIPVFASDRGVLTVGQFNDHHSRTFERLIDSQSPDYHALRDVLAVTDD